MRQAAARRAAMGTLVVVAALHAWFRAFLIDDAYISFRYARHLAEGNGLVFNLGERVEGYTNFLWTVLISGALSVGASPGRFAQALGIASSLALLVVLYRWGRDAGMPGWWSLLAPAMLAVNRSYAAWSTGGLETRFFTLLVAAAAWRFTVERAAARGHGLATGSGLLLSLACLTRPEGYLAAAAAIGATALAAASGGTRERRHLAGVALPVAAVAAAHFGWRIAYYGDWLPNSFRAKVPGPRIAGGLLYLGVFAAHHLVAPALVLTGGLALARRIRGPLISAGRTLGPMPLVFCAGYSGYVLVVGGDHFEFRFMDPVFPFLALAAAVALSQAASAASPASRLAAAWLLAASAAISTAAGFQDIDRVIGPSGKEQYVSIVSVETEARYLARWERIGRWLAENAAWDESIALRPAGAIPYFSQLRTLDMFGINDREIARLPGRAESNVGHDRWVGADYVRSRGVTYLIGSPAIMLDRPGSPPAGAAEVDFGDFHWYFWPLQQNSRVRPGTRFTDHLAK